MDCHIVHGLSAEEKDLTVSIKDKLCKNQPVTDRLHSTVTSRTHLPVDCILYNSQYMDQVNNIKIIS